MPNEQANQTRQLNRISMYLREIASFNRRAELARALEAPERRRAYELSDGERNSEEIAGDPGVSGASSTIRNWWREWRTQGLIEDEFTGYPRHRYVTFVIDVESRG